MTNLKLDFLSLLMYFKLDLLEIKAARAILTDMFSDEQFAVELLEHGNPKDFLNSLDHSYDNENNEYELHAMIWLTDGSWITNGPDTYTDVFGVEDDDMEAFWIHYQCPEIPVNLKHVNTDKALIANKQFASSIATDEVLITNSLEIKLSNAPGNNYAFIGKAYILRTNDRNVQLGSLFIDSEWVDMDSNSIKLPESWEEFIGEVFRVQYLVMDYLK